MSSIKTIQGKRWLSIERLLINSLNLERRRLHAEKEEDESIVETKTEDVAVSLAWERFKESIGTGNDDDD